MSRIHEALKKAEQERAQGTAAAAAPSIEAPMAEPFPADDLARETVPAVLPPAVQSALAEMTGSARLSSDDLHAKCRRTEWKPDKSKMLFFDGHNSERVVGSEEFRTLRSKLYQMRGRQMLRSLVVSSALPGEGKSFVAANLAQVIARQAGRKVLLIDGDLRCSRLHQYLGTPIKPGLVEYLRGTASETEVMQQGPLEGLYLIAGGESAQQPAELISNGKLKSLIERMTATFDWIVVDSPPILPVADASVLADMCDGVLLVVEASNTRTEAAQKARQEMHNRPLLGVVLNRAPRKAGYHHYYYGYGTSTGEAKPDGKEATK